MEQKRDKIIKDFRKELSTKATATFSIHEYELPLPIRSFCINIFHYVTFKIYLLYRFSENG